MKTIKLVAFVQLFLGFLFIAYGILTPKQSVQKAPASVEPLVKEQVEQNHQPLFPQKLVISNGKKENVKTSVLLNDPDIYKNWGLKVSDALKARGITDGSRDVKVAIIDTGIDAEHKDLKNNLWQNPGETGLDKNGKDKSTNGVDDDKNGFVDDVHGWNFVGHSNNLTDNHGHGTHIAGIIGAEGGNNFGITGISPKVSLMVLKYYDPKQPGDNLKNTIKAIEYAIDNGAQIINYSGGGTDYSKLEFEAIRKARSKGVLFVAAAGNEHSNSDQKKYYPANYDLDNIISVTAINPELQVLPSSNYGVQTVHVAAPGEEIYSTKPGNSFGTLTGTSQATAFASGLAALIKANNSDFDYLAIKKHILETGDEYPWLKSKTGTSKKLNIYKALTALDKGVGASGVIAANTVGLKQGSFSSDPQSATGSSETNQFVEFGKILLQSMEAERTINNN